MGERRINIEKEDDKAAEKKEESDVKQPVRNIP